MKLTVVDIDEEDDGLFVNELYIIIATDSSGNSKEFIDMFDNKELAYKIAGEFEKYFADDVATLGDFWLSTT